MVRRLQAEGAVVAMVGDGVQPWAWPHVRSHLDMLGLAMRTKDRAEIAGQLFRVVVAGPGSATGRSPVGNTGRADVSATMPMPVPDELAALLAAS